MKRALLVIYFFMFKAGFAQQVAHLQPTFDQMMGVNVTYKDPLGRLNVAGIIREFHVWSWNQPMPEIEDWNPQQHTDFGQYYSNLDALGLVVVPVIQQTPAWLLHPGMNEQSQPLDNDQLKGKANGFTKHAAFMKRFAEFFAPNGIKYLENWNEPDKDWFGPTATFKPGEFAALCSADYDAVRSLQPTGNDVILLNSKTGREAAHIDLVNGSIPQAPVKLVMGGLAYPSIDYLQGLVQWSQLNRKNNKPPFDVINLHHYSNSAAEHTSPRNGISPEEDHLREKMSEFVQFRNQNMPDKELWVSEFGYDTWIGSSQGVASVSGQSAEETQAQWIIRSFLAFAAAGVDRAILFALSDAGDPKIRYNTSGLLTNNEGIIVPKQSWYYVSALRNILHGTRFNKEINSSDPEVRIYKFSDSQNKRDVYAIWCPTSKGKRVNYTLTGQGQSPVQIVSLARGSLTGETKIHEVEGNRLTLEISESPVFLISGKTDPSILQIKRIPITQSMLTGPIEAQGIIDEQNQGDPFQGTFVENKSSGGWTNNSTKPIEAVIDFKTKQPVKGIYLKDTFNEGIVSVYYLDQSGEWKQIVKDPMRRYFVWDPYFFKTPLSTDKLKVVLEGKTENKTSCLGEIMVYTEE